jgi:hypothetical protein
MRVCSMGITESSPPHVVLRDSVLVSFQIKQYARALDKFEELPDAALCTRVPLICLLRHPLLKLRGCNLLIKRSCVSCVRPSISGCGSRKGLTRVSLHIDIAR